MTVLNSSNILFFQNMYRLTCIFIFYFGFVAGYRLPRDVIPEHYKLEIICHLGENDDFRFEGTVWIQVSKYILMVFYFEVDI